MNQNITIMNNETEWNEFRDSYIKSALDKFHQTPPHRVKRLSDYLTIHNIKDVVLGVSGGVDSALVLAMLVYIKETGTIPDLNINAYCVTFDNIYPNFDKSYVTELVERFNTAANIQILDLIKD